jgi:hypothetical protein
MVTYLGIPQSHPILTLVKPVICQSRDHFNRFFNKLCVERPLDVRAEGIVLRDPNAWYFQRNTFFQKEVNNSDILS